MNDRAASATIGVLLMVAIAVVASAGTYLIADQAFQAPPSTQFTLVRLDTDEAAATVHASIYAGEPIEVTKGAIIVTMDGLQTRHALSEFPEIAGDTWSASEPLCIVGPGCLYSQGSKVDVVIIAGDTVMGRTTAFVKAFVVRPDGGILVNCEGDVFVDIVGVQITHGENGPAIPVFVDYTEDDSASFEALFGGSPASGGDLAHRYAMPGDILGIRGTADDGGFFSQYSSTVSSDHVAVLIDGDVPPDFKPFGNQTGVEVFMEPYLDEAGLIDLNPNQVILLFEFTTSLESAAADFQDLVVLFTFPTAGCEV